MIISPSMHADENKHCWECRRRRLVCGGEQPICAKCRTSGVVCPGYGDTKPLVWITPGKVVSRTWKRKSRVHTKELCERVPTLTSPSRELRTDAHVIMEALEFYNTCVLENHLRTHLGHNHFISRIPSINLFPQSTIHTLISSVINYRVFRATHDGTRPALSTTRELYRHQQLAIRDLGQLIGDEQKATSDETICAIYTLVIAVLQQSLTPIWRPHFDAFLEIVIRRGGFLCLTQSSPNLCLLLYAFWVIGVLANTTTPPREYIPIVCSEPETITLALSLFDRVLYPFLQCPTEIFAHIVTINRLRCQVLPDNEISAPEHSDELVLTSSVVTPLTVLKQIEEFSVSDWADIKDPSHPDDWLLLGQIFQSATALFCLLSLDHLIHDEAGQDAAADDAITFMTQQHTNNLLALLVKGGANPMVKKSLVWPMVVAGVAAAREGPEARSFISRTLCATSRAHGSSLPLVAKAALEKFWMSGKTRWDDCFDVPYCFIV